MTSENHDERLRWAVHDERTLYDNKWVRLVQVDVVAPNGDRWWHHVVRLGHVAVTVVVDDVDRVLMLWRHRFATEEWGWELPGGIVEAGEAAATAAVRETVEETGWKPREPLERLSAYQPMPGMVDTPHEVFLARGADKIGEPQDAEEASVIDWIPLTDVPDLLTRGKILGSGSLIGLLLTLTKQQRG
ncbi:NUDIX domain-containing protein [Actinopolymorpha sp. B11F2]|uniref:NUDIX domain-containing protein n=1 Tax=Actinopolymorpha sp. B11F2 TaxID=3160862 RepID=UPI0032E39058